ncbi:MAG TPA: hypothetical protein VLE73_05895 [Candidatus Saccharimonadales bacterium]|nr:hypothetical protein [Candidatus Saccharimonadales bacterium]
MSIDTTHFHSPPPAELGTVSLADFENLAAVSYSIGCESMPLAPDSLDYHITPEGAVSVMTDTRYDPDGTWGATKYSLLPVDARKSRALGEALKPFIATGQGWLHDDVDMIVGFFRSLQRTSDAGRWHVDSTSAKEGFRAILLYDARPTQFAVGTLALDTLGTERPLTPWAMRQFLSSYRIEEALESKNEELTVVNGPAALHAAGITHEHIHRAAAVPRSMNDIQRTFLRLATIRPQQEA